MIQDIAPHVFNNQYSKKREPNQEDLVLAFTEQNELLIKGDGIEQGLELPRAENFDKSKLTFLFTIDDKAYFLYFEVASLNLDGYSYKSVHVARTDNPRVTSFAIATAFHLYTWYSKTRFCGTCGHKLVPYEKVRAMICPECKKIFYPNIAPAVIVAILNGDKVLVTRYKERVYRGIALIAGFCEIGESAEETAKREAMEEVGLKIKDLKYFGSQPWGFDSNLLVGYIATVDGSDKIIRDAGELSEAVWLSRDEIEDVPSDISLTKTMIQYLKDRKDL